jgi:hypothetical protein
MVTRVDVRSEPESTAARVAELRRYMRRNVLRGHEFVCRSWEACERSVGGSDSFTEGQLSHVGQHYDLTVGGRSLRVVVVGQEVGAAGGPRITLADRHRAIATSSGLEKRFLKEPGRPRRNPHMRGTTLALRRVFGLTGLDHEGEFLDLDSTRAHLFECFALVNRLLCAAHAAGTSTGVSTKTMMTNCERHFEATMRILDPTVVIIQGIRVWRWSQGVLGPRQQLSDHLFLCDPFGRDVLVATFSHPSARGPLRWDLPEKPYVRHVVGPTLDRVRRELLASAPARRD